jgi:hypothetical protein
VPNAVRRLRPEPRTPFLSGFVAVELASDEPTAQPATSARPRGDAPVADLPPQPPAVMDVGPNWAERDSLFGE